MTNKQILATVVGVGVIIIFSAFVYRQFLTQSQTAFQQQQNKNAMQPVSEGMPQPAPMVPLPDTIDGITADIESETTLDLSAMDEESAGEESVLNEDSQSVNNLGTSYDENNF